MRASRRTVSQLAEAEGLCTATVRRYVHEGVGGPDGTRVYLRATRVGGRLFVDDGDWAAFISLLNPTKVEALIPRQV